MEPKGHRQTPVSVKSNDWTLPDWGLFLLLVAAVLVAYQPVRFAGFVWDDDMYVTRNRLLTAPDGWRLIWFSLQSPSQYFPLAYSVLRLEHGLWGDNPFGYHAVNVLIHCANAVLLWRLLRRLAVPGAWLGAALFALHPVNVESVAWVAELKNVLSLLFYLLALRAWVEFIADKTRNRGRFYVLTLLGAALALFSKTTACTLPAALVCALWFQGKKLNRARVLQLAPFVVFGLGMGLVSMWWERFHQHTEGAAFNIGWLTRFLVASRALWFYLGKVVWPTHLAFSYAKWDVRPDDLTAWIWPALTAGLAFAAWRLRHLFGRGISLALLFYVAALSPLLGFIMEYTFRYTFVADHYQYIALIAPCALAGAAAGAGWNRANFRPALAVFAAAIVLTLGWRTRQQSALYVNDEALWRASLAEVPDSAIAHNNLAGALLAQARENPEKVDEAISLANEVLKNDPNNPGAQNCLGNGLMDKGQAAEAVPHFQAAIAARPGDPAGYYNLGMAGLALGAYSNAVPWFEKSIELDAYSAPSWCNLGDALRGSGRNDEAIVADQKAVELAPNYALAQNDLGSLLLQARRVNEALPHLERATELDPAFAEPQYNLGEALLMLGRRDEAVAHYRIALQIRPDLAPAARRLSQLTGRPAPP